MKRGNPGHPKSESHRQALRDAWARRHDDRVQALLGRVSERRGKTYDEIYGDRAQLEREKRTKPLSRDSARLRDWSESVRNRDDYTCQMCGAVNTSNHAHHRVPMEIDPELALVISNGITLCRSCHGKIHPGRYWEVKEVVISKH